jgi:hypothetical protein
MDGTLSLPIFIALLISAFPYGVTAEEGDPSVEVTATLQADYVQDFKRVDGNWDDTLRPSRIPTEDGAFGEDGQAIISARQSGIGINGQTTAGGKPLRGVFSFDMFGQGNNEGETTFHLKDAYGQWGPWLAGQAYTLFMDPDIFPNVVDYWGPSGMVYVRNPQIRYIVMDDEQYRFAVAIEKPSDDVDPGRVREIDPALSDSLQGTEEVPDVTAQFRYSGDWGHVQAAGIVRFIGFETIGTPDNEPKDEETGWGLDLTGTFNLFDGNDQILVGGVVGEGIASYMNDGGTDLSGEGTLVDPRAKTVPLYGVSAYYNHQWKEGWTSAIGYSRTEVDNTDLQDDDAFHVGQYASANLLYSPEGFFTVGAEALWGEREDNDGATGDDFRIQVTFRYNFARTITRH